MLDLHTAAMDALDLIPNPPGYEARSGWLWDGLLRRGEITLLTSFWKTGKSTLVAGLARALADGSVFLGRAVCKGTVSILSEEGPGQWRERVAQQPIGGHATLAYRRSVGRPSEDEWIGMIEAILACGPDLVVVDTLAAFLPGHGESDAQSMLHHLEPLRRFCGIGAAVLLLHHPRKRRAETGQAARGSGALTGFVETILELHLCGSLHPARRVIRAQSRRIETPDSLAYEWDRATGEFTAVDEEAPGAEHWGIVERILAAEPDPLTAKQIGEHWPEAANPPGRSSLYNWLDDAIRHRLVERDGRGTRLYPYRYRLTRA